MLTASRRPRGPPQPRIYGTVCVLQIPPVLVTFAHSTMTFDGSLGVLPSSVWVGRGGQPHGGRCVSHADSHVANAADDAEVIPRIVAEPQQSV